MFDIIKEIATSLVFPIILSIIAYYLERNKNRNKYEEMYTKVFAPIEKIKLENPKIIETMYISKIEKILFNDDVYPLVPPKFLDKFLDYKNKETDKKAFDKIIDDNTNELRKFIGMPHRSRANYKSSPIYVKRNINFLLLTILIIIFLCSLAFPIAMMYPSTYDKIEQVFKVAEIFVILYFYAVILFSGIVIIPLVIKNSVEKVRLRSSEKGLFRSLVRFIIEVLGALMVFLFIFGLLTFMLSKYDNFNMEELQQESSTIQIEQSV